MERGGGDVLDEERLLAGFALLAGTAGQETEKWAPLCRACAEELEGRLRRDADREDERVYLAAAAEAAYRRAMILHSGQSGLNFSGPGLSVAANGGHGEDLRRLRDEMLALCSGLLEDDMVFSAV